MCLFKAVGCYYRRASHAAQPWSPPAGSASFLHLDCTPLHLALDQRCFPFSTPSSLSSPREAAWRLLLAASPKAHHTAAYHLPWTATVAGLPSITGALAPGWAKRNQVATPVLHTRHTPKWSSGSTCTPKMTVFFLPVAKFRENEAVTPPPFQIANIWHIFHI